MADVFGQGEYAVRFDWGPNGALTTRADLAVVVDVLSFSTTVTVAVERGMRVFPYRWQGPGAAEFAARNDAALAVGRLEALRGDAVMSPTLSPAGLLHGPAYPRLVLASPNGATIAQALDDGATTVTIGCLRNAQAVALWLAPLVSSGRSVAVVAAGERWDADDSLRPAIEDLLGAGAVLAALMTLVGGDGFSPEASLAAEASTAGRERLATRLHDCASGRELAAKGFGADVDVAADLNSSSVVPVLVAGAFDDAESAQKRATKGSQ